MEEIEHISKICPKTLRPYHNIDKIKEEEPAQLLKECKYFEAFVFKYEKIPNADELILFLYNRYVEAGKYTTLPFMTKKWVE